MSALRLGILPNGLRDIRIEEPATARITYSRRGIRGGGEFVVAESQRYHVPDKRVGAHRKDAHR